MSRIFAGGARVCYDGGSESNHQQQEVHMPRLPGLSPWQQTVSSFLPHLSQPQVTVLVFWSVGIVLAQRCGLTSVAVILAYLLDVSERTLRERLRDWYRDAPQRSGARRGRKRCSLEVQTCFAPVLRWVIAWMDHAHRQLVLVLDASTLGDRFTILTIAVVVRGCAIPVAWQIVEAKRPGAWKPHWEAMLTQLHGAVPPDWTVIVPADRGLYAKWLYQAIVAQGWHPYLRINRQGQYRPSDETDFRPLSQVVRTGGPAWAGPVLCFKTPQRQLSCTLLARWMVGYKDPWLIVTDLPPAVADVAWYGLRAWIECGFKDAKRGGWHWEQTKMRDPRRAERLWLAMAVATLWVVSVGSQAEVAMPLPDLAALPPQHVARQRASGRRAPRGMSCFQRGRLLIVAALCGGQPVPLGRLHPEPWPKSLDTAPIPVAEVEPHGKAVKQKAYT